MLTKVEPVVLAMYELSGDTKGLDIEDIAVVASAPAAVPRLAQSVSDTH